MRILKRTLILATVAFAPLSAQSVYPPSGRYTVIGTGLDLVQGDGIHYTPAVSFALPGPAGGMATLRSGYLEISGSPGSRTFVFRYEIQPRSDEDVETRSLTGTVTDRAGGTIFPLTVTAPANFGTPTLVRTSGVYYLLLGAHVRVKLGNPTVIGS